jgi:hypothetical protein
MAIFGFGEGNDHPAGPGPERRHFPRLTLGVGFHARFLVGDELVPAADLLDLSAGGCCLVGVEFRDIPGALGRAIAAYVDRQLAGGPGRP